MPDAIDPNHARITTPAPFDLFWNYRRREPTPLNWLRAARAAIVWRSRPGRKSIPIFLRLGGWIVRFPPDVARFLRRNGATWQEAFGRSRSGQFGDMCLLAVTNGLMPRDYYRSDIAAKRGAPGFFSVIPYNLYATPVTVLSARDGGASFAIVADKAETARLLGAGGVATPPTCLLFRDGAVAGPDGAAAELPATDLVVKPVSSIQGRDVAIWRHDADTGFWSCGGQSLDSKQLIAAIADQSHRMPGGAIVQPALKNRADIAPYAPYALSTFRTVTALDERGDPEVVVCQFRTAVDPASDVDNFHAGGCMFFVDLATGRFTRGWCGDYADSPVAHGAHPANGEPMTGVAVPGLEEVRALAVRAHRLLPDLLCIGWDIALTDSGPVVIEANVPPGLQPTQQMSMGGFTGTRFMELLGFHARRWIEENEPEASRFRVGAAISPGNRKGR